LKSDSASWLLPARSFLRSLTTATRSCPEPVAVVLWESASPSSRNNDAALAMPTWRQSRKPLRRSRTIEHEEIAGLSAGNAMIFLEAAAEALNADYSIMPHDTCEAVGLAQEPS
jgi:hypothetical protein